MAGHSQFKNIMHRKGAQDSKRAKLFTKLIREIITSVRISGIDTNFNTRLRSAIATAKTYNLPKDRIENAIKKGSNPNDGENYEEIRYEGYAPGGVAVIIEALSDNKNRTASVIRSAFNKVGGNLGAANSVNFMFERLGLFEYSKAIMSEDEIFEIAIASEAEVLDMDELNYKIYSSIESFNNVKERLTKILGEPELSILAWRPQNLLLINQEIAEPLNRLIDLLEDSDDVQYIFTNHKLN